MNQPVRTVSPAGEPIVILSESEYERLVEAAETARDARVAEAALAAYKADPGTALGSDELKQLLAAPTPLAFWRRKRGLSQAALAAEVGCKQPYLAQLELGRRKGTRDTFRKLAAILNVTLDDLDEATRD